MTTATASNRIRNAVAALALATAVAAPATLAATAAPAAAASHRDCEDWGCGANHNEEAAVDTPS